MPEHWEKYNIVLQDDGQFTLQRFCDIYIYIWLWTVILSSDAVKRYRSRLIYCYRIRAGIVISYYYYRVVAAFAMIRKTCPCRGFGELVKRTAFFSLKVREVDVRWECENYHSPVIDRNRLSILYKCFFARGGANSTTHCWVQVYLQKLWLRQE